MIDLLSNKEIAAITGAARRKQQIQWLQDRMWPHEINHFGYPVVLRSVALERLGAEPKQDNWRLDEANIA